jgi:DNA-binding MarR family transcriptional regulator
MVSTRIARFLAPMWESRYGLTVQTWRIMAIIGRYGPISAKELATRGSSDAFHVSRAIEQLARKKLIKRDVDPRDRRRAKLELTASGRAAHQAIGKALTRLENELLQRLSVKDQQLLLRALATVDERALALMASGLTWKDFL